MIQLGRLLYPQLTTVREFPEQLGKQMAQLILDRIASPSQDPQRVIIPTELVKRDSCRQIDSSRSDRSQIALRSVFARGEPPN